MVHHGLSWFMIVYHCVSPMNGLFWGLYAPFSDKPIGNCAGKLWKNSVLTGSLVEFPTPAALYMEMKAGNSFSPRSKNHIDLWLKSQRHRQRNGSRQLPCAVKNDHQTTWPPSLTLLERSAPKVEMENRMTELEWVCLKVRNTPKWQFYCGKWWLNVWPSKLVYAIFKHTWATSTQPVGNAVGNCWNNCTDPQPVECLPVLAT